MERIGRNGQLGLWILGRPYICGRDGPTGVNYSLRFHHSPVNPSNSVAVQFQSSVFYLIGKLVQVSKTCCYHPKYDPFLKIIRFTQNKCGTSLVWSCDNDVLVSFQFSERLKMFFR